MTTSTKKTALQAKSTNAREPKSTVEMTINITGRTGAREGRFHLTSGNFHFWKPSAKVTPTVTLTMQQLARLLEKQARFEALDTDADILPKSKGNDFSWHVAGLPPHELEAEPLGIAGCKVKSLRHVGFQEGSYELRSELKTRKGWKYPLSTFVSIHGALWLVNFYVDRLLEERRADTTTNKFAVVSKAKLKHVLETWLKRLETPVANS
jgi:hypothetical protein